MKLLIIGHSVEDHILKENNEQIKPGGIYYTASALNCFKVPDDEIFILTAIEKNNYKLFSSVYDNFNSSYFQTVNSIPKVFLKIHKEDERDECYNSITENIKIGTIPDIGSFDGILINMITGFDINLEQLLDLRKSFKGPIYFDVHTLSRGLEKDGSRKFRIIPEFKNWASNLDFIQVNERELLTLSNKTDGVEIIMEILNAGTKYLIVTMEDSGSKVFFLNDGELNSIFKSAIKVEVNNKIGCGDIFGAVFFYTYFMYKNINKSLDLANISAGLVASYKDIAEIKKLKENVLSRYN